MVILQAKPPMSFEQADVMAICSIDGCSRPVHVKIRQLCHRHYDRLRLHGSPLGGARSLDGAPSRFLEMAKEYYGDECLTWPYRRSRGRGLVHISGRGTSFTVSRLVCEHAYGPAPLPGMEAAHSCGRGHLGCVARKHLRWATPKENTADKVIHGTLLKGEAHPNAKLSVEAVRQIRRLRPATPINALADMFCVSPRTISNVVSGKAWAHV